MNSIQPIHEFEQRYSRIQAAMQSEDLDVLLVYSWKRGQVRYVSGYHPSFLANVAMVVMPRIGQPYLIVRFLFDIERARRESWIGNIEASGSVLEMAPRAARIVRELGLAKHRIGIVSGDYVIDEMSHELYDALMCQLPDARFINASHLFENARLYKSEFEFSVLRRSARVADDGVYAARKSLQPGKTEYEVVAAAECKMRNLGAEMHLVTITSDGLTTLISPPTSRVIKKGANVLVEIAVQKDGYMTQAAHTYFIGGPTEEQKSVYNATFLSYLAGVAAAKPGQTCEVVAGAIHAELNRLGFGDFLEHDMGHGIGIDLPELPRIEYGDKTLIEAGMVLVIHPSVRVPGVGSTFIGGTVLIHPDGAEPIHNIPDSPYLEASWQQK